VDNRLCTLHVSSIQWTSIQCSVDRGGTLEGGPLQGAAFIFIIFDRCPSMGTDQSIAEGLQPSAIYRTHSQIAYDPCGQRLRTLHVSSIQWTSFLIAESLAWNARDSAIKNNARGHRSHSMFRRSRRTSFLYAIFDCVQSIGAHLWAPIYQKCAAFNVSSIAAHFIFVRNL